jgi:predicted RNA-binding Zn ribbon-like protein
VLRFRELRDQISALVRAHLTGQTADAALERVNALAAAAHSAGKAVRGGEQLVRALNGEPGYEAFLAAVARDAVELLTDPAARARLRQCEGDNCALVYLDAS